MDAAAEDIAAASTHTGRNAMQQFDALTVQTRVAAGDDLVLIARHPSDADEVFALVERHRTTLGEWLTWLGATKSVSDVRRYAHFANVQFESRVAFDYSIRLRGAIVGAIGLHGIDWAHRSAQIGYWLVPEARGSGTMTRAAAAITTHAFDDLDIHRLEIRCVVENTRSRAVAERLGYAHEGTLAEAYLLHEIYRNISLYGMTISSWRNATAS